MLDNNNQIIAVAQPNTLEGGGCTLFRPGRGDCEHFVGLPGLAMEVDHDGPNTEDLHGKPNGWCWLCWRGYKITQLECKARELTERAESAEQTRQTSWGVLRDQLWAITELVNPDADESDWDVHDALTDVVDYLKDTEPREPEPWVKLLLGSGWIWWQGYFRNEYAGETGVHPDKIKMLVDAGWKWAGELWMKSTLDSSGVMIVSGIGTTAEALAIEGAQ